MAEVAYSLEDGARDLIEAPESSVPATYDPGTIQSDAPAEYPSTGGLTVEEAAGLIEDDAPTGRTVAHNHDGRPLSLSQLVEGFNEGLSLVALLHDVHARYQWVREAGENVIVSANAIAELLLAIFPPPSVALANADPLEYQRAKAVADEIHTVVIQVCEQAQQTAWDQVQWASAQLPRDNIAFEAARFRDTYPQGDNPEWMKQFGTRITRAAEHCGYHQSELAAITDHRALKVLDLAASALEKRQGSSKREGAKPPKRSGPRLVSNGGSLSLTEAMDLDFD